MLLFRSEEHLEEWIKIGNPAGEALSVQQQWDLARAWFRDRHLPSWKKRTAAESRSLFASVGLVSDFWSFE
jgi:hypothetical protein